MSQVITFKEELRSLGYSSSRIDRAYTIYNTQHGVLRMKGDDKEDRDLILEILLHSAGRVPEQELSAAEQVRQSLVYGFIRQFEAERLQIPVVINQMCLPFYGSCFVNNTALSLDDILSLEVGDHLDHRDFAGLFASATVLQKDGLRIYLHYNDWTSKWDRWSDAEVELFRFAKHESVSKREGHRMADLEEGDYVDINPIHTRPKYKRRHSGWKHAEIKQICDGQIKVSYKVPHGNPHKTYLYWVHLDNVDEVAPFTTKAGSVRLSVLDHYPLDSLRDDEDIFSESTAKMSLSEIFGTDQRALHCCIAQEVYGSSSTKHVDTVRGRCEEWMRRNPAAMQRAQSMAKYMGCGGRANEAELQIAVAVLADTFSVRIKVYCYDDHISPNNDELVTLWADYTGNPGSGMGEGTQCRLICLAKLRNAFGILKAKHDEPLLLNEREHSGMDTVSKRENGNSRLSQRGSQAVPRQSE